MNRRLIFLIAMLFVLLWVGNPRRAYSQTLSPEVALGSGFTYQGLLKDVNGAPVNNTCTFIFSLWDSVSGGAQIGSDSSVIGVNVVYGYFSVMVNPGGEFGAHPFDNANARWLEIEVRCANELVYTTLSPRQPVSSTPPTHDHRGQTWSGTTGTGLTLLGGDTGMIATGTSSGVEGTAYATSGSGTGVIGYSDSTAGTGVLGYAYQSNGYTYGVRGLTVSPTGSGVAGLSYASTGATYGVYGWSQSTEGRGVVGYTTSSIGHNYGVWGQSNSTVGTGVFGLVSSTTGTIYGVWGRSTSTDGRGVFGDNLSSEGNSIGVEGVSYSTSGYGVAGTGYIGVYGNSSLPSGWAGWFEDNVLVNGYLSKAGGGFKIDHPLDPANQYLNHSFVESPEMKDVYDGVVTLDGNGEAVIIMPDWFEALNQDFRYQLTPIGGSMPNLFIASGVQNNQFQIAGGLPGMQVSWQVTGVRHDPWAVANRMPVEQPKSSDEQGKYLHPELYGFPPDLGIGQLARPGMQPSASLPTLPTAETPLQPN
jgi:hypothetical protein